MQRNSSVFAIQQKLQIIRNIYHLFLSKRGKKVMQRILGGFNVEKSSLFTNYSSIDIYIKDRIYKPYFIY